MTQPANVVPPNANSATYAAVVTPGSTILQSTRGLYVGGVGNVEVLMQDDGPAGTPVIFYNVPAGTVLPIRVTKVTSSGTTATNILALW